MNDIASRFSGLDISLSEMISNYLKLQCNLAKWLMCVYVYSRLFGRTGTCSACGQTIPGFEQIMRAKDNIYHLNCFICQYCNQK